MMFSGPLKGVVPSKACPTTGSTAGFIGRGFQALDGRSRDARPVRTVNQTIRWNIDRRQFISNLRDWSSPCAVPSRTHLRWISRDRPSAPKASSASFVALSAGIEHPLVGLICSRYPSAALNKNEGENLEPRQCHHLRSTPGKSPGQNKLATL